MKKIMNYILNILLALDCLGTALIGGFYGETMSSYAYRLDQQHKLGGKIFRPAIDWLFAWQNKQGGHCYHAWVDLKQRHNMPPELR